MALVQQKQPGPMVMHVATASETASTEKKDTVVEVSTTTGTTRTYTIFDILTNLSLHDYVAIFEGEGYDSVQDLQNMAEADWDTLVAVTALKPRHAIRLKRRLQAISSEQEIIMQETVSESKTGDASLWTEALVWQWISSKPYGNKLTESAWEFTDGPTLLALDFTTAKQLMPKFLIPRVLKDIKLIAKDSRQLAMSKKTRTLEGHVGQIQDLLENLAAIDYRDQAQSFGDEFGRSVIRVSLVMAITYAVLAFYMYLISADRPLTGAIVPTIGFQLSTLTLPSVRDCYVGHKIAKFKKKEEKMQHQE